jgi:hypothetical protein
MASVILGNKTRKPKDTFKGVVSTDKKRTTFAADSGIHHELISNLMERRRDLSSVDTTSCDSKIAVLKTEIKESEGKRWLVRTVLDKKSQLEKLQKERSDIIDGLPLRLFDDEMRPVMRRLRSAAEKNIAQPIADAEREVRKRLTKPTDAISLQRAIVGDMCDDCGVSMQIIASDSLLGCPQCAKSRIIPIVSAPVADSEFVSIPYAQKSRLVEWLEFCQGKEYAEPVPEVLELIMEELVAQRATGLEDFIPMISKERDRGGPFLSFQNAMDRLKGIPKLKDKLLSIKPCLVRNAMQTASFKHQDDRVRKYYERAPKYTAFINGFWPLRFTSSQEERIRSLYAVAIPAYEKYRKPSQPNWPGGYAYFLRSLCVLLGWDEFIDHFNLKSGNKHIADRENMRKRIWTSDLDWEYIPCEPGDTSLSVGGKRKRI